MRISTWRARLGGEDGRDVSGTAMQGVGHQAGQDAGEELRVGDHIGQALGRAEGDVVATRAQVVEGRGDNVVKIDWPEIGLQRPGVQPAEIAEVGDEPADAVHRAARNGDQSGAIVRCGSGSVISQACQGSLGCGELFAGVLTGGGEQGGAGTEVSLVLGGAGVLLVLAAAGNAGHDLDRAGGQNPRVVCAKHASPPGQREGLADREFHVGSGTFWRPFACAGHDVAARACVILPPFQQADRGQAEHLAYLLKQGGRVAAPA